MRRRRPSDRSARGLAELAAWSAFTDCPGSFSTALWPALPDEAREAALERTLDMVARGL